MTLSRRALVALQDVRDRWNGCIDLDGLVFERGEKEVVLWSMAGLRAHETIAAALPSEFTATSTNETVRFDVAVGSNVLRAAAVDMCLPEVPDDAISGLRFSAALPHDLARATPA